MRRPSLSPRFASIDSPPPEKPILLPFKADSIQRQGWVNKRPESDFKRSKSGVPAVWKLQRAIVHDSRLYLYNPPSSLGIKAFTPSQAPELTTPPIVPTHIKHAHSPSETLAGQATPSHINLDELARRPSTAPHVLETGINLFPAS